jgi:hypothetical protein
MRGRFDSTILDFHTEVGFAAVKIMVQEGSLQLSRDAAFRYYLEPVESISKPHNPFI